MATNDPTQTSANQTAQALTPDPASAMNQTNTQASTTTTAPQMTMQQSPTGTSSGSSVTGVDSSVPQMTPAQITSSPTWNNTSDQTTAGQLGGIIGSNSPLMQQAQTTALEGMNSRGLLNSSMAQTAGQSAVLNAALPIAQSDAAQASKVAGTNVANTNQDIAANVAAQNSASNANLAAANQQSIANTEANYKDLTQGSLSAASILNNSQNSINAINANTSMDAASKAKAIADIQANLKNSMGLIGGLAGNVNLQQYIDQATA